MRLYKKRLSWIILSLFFFIYPVYAEEFNITGENVILYNLNDDRVLYNKNEKDKTQIASLTKIMTTLVALDNINNLNESVTITLKDFEGTNGYSKAGFKVGDIVTYEDLLYGVLLPSGADAVNAVVNSTCGYDSFVKKMNEKALEIGMNDTKFSNPIGKDDDENYSTASDVAKMLKYALKNDEFKKIFTTKKYTTTNGIILNSTLNSYSDFLKIGIIDGAKSGFTKKAGRCLASVTNLNGVNYLLVIINSSTDEAYSAVEDTINIYSYYDENYSYQTIISDDTFIKDVSVYLSKTKTYKITGSEDVKIYLKNGSDVTYVYDGIDNITYKTKKGTKLGIVKIYDGETLLAESSVYLEDNISYYPLEIVYGFIIVIIFIIIRIKRKKRRRRKK